jgi:parallel beta-helix repeat protein
MTANNAYGILIRISSNFNTVSGNIITRDEDGVYLDSSSNNTVSGNHITNNEDGVDLISSRTTLFRGTLSLTMVSLFEVPIKIR